MKIANETLISESGVYKGSYIFYKDGDNFSIAKVNKIINREIIHTNISIIKEKDVYTITQANSFQSLLNKIQILENLTEKSILSFYT